MFVTMFTRYMRFLSISKMSMVSVIVTLGSITFAAIAISAPLLFWAESGQENANIRSLGDAIWLCFMIVTTIGFGDFYPVSLLGRLVAVPLAACGIGMFGTLAGYFGSLLLDKIVRQATTDMLHSQNRRIEELSKMNNQLNTAIHGVAEENKRLNELIVEISKQNKLLNAQISEDTRQILAKIDEIKPRD